MGRRDEEEIGYGRTCPPDGYRVHRPVGDLCLPVALFPRCPQGQAAPRMARGAAGWTYDGPDTPPPGPQQKCPTGTNNTVYTGDVLQKINTIQNVKQIPKPKTFPNNSFTDEIRRHIDEHSMTELTYTIFCWKKRTSQ